MSFSKSVQAHMNADAAERAKVYSDVYVEIVGKVAVAAAAVKVHTDKAKEERGGTWSAFRSALAVGMVAGHTVTALRIGLEVACENAKIPAGSYRSYVNTLASMYEEIAAGTLTLIDAEKMKIADARKRYRVQSDVEKQFEALKAAVKGWKADELAMLVAIATGTADADEVEAVTDAAVKHVTEREQAAAKAEAEKLAA